MKEELLRAGFNANCGIYIIKSVSGGEYVGSSINIRKRLRGHEKALAEGVHHSRALQSAWVKYGPDGFIFRTLLICSKTNLLLYEQAAIDSFHPEYNMSPTAGNCLGVKHSADVRAKMASYGMLGKNQSQYQKDKVSSTHKGKVISEETRVKMQLAARSRPLTSEATKKKISDSSRGKPRPKPANFSETIRKAKARMTASEKQQMKDKISLTQKERNRLNPETPETRYLKSQSHLGMKHSPETKEKIRQANLKRWSVIHQGSMK